MAKIDRYDGNLQAPASAALGTERTLFGSASQSDDLTGQFNANLLRGWGIVGPSDQPTLQDFNAMGYTLGQLHAYLHQMGVAEWNAAQEYHLGSIANVAGVLYVSRVNTNVGNAPASSPGLWIALNQGGVVGTSRNASMLVATASAAGTFTADELIVADSVSGRQWRLASISATINLGTTGAGGMDAGLAPVSGYVALYVIYNPTTLDVAMLATDATSVAAPDVYGGANMPAGYTASALVSVVQTNASRQFATHLLSGRRVSIEAMIALNNSSVARASPFALSLSGQIPLNAVSVSGALNIGSTAAGIGSLFVGCTSAMFGYQGAAYAGSQTTPGGQGSFNIPVSPAVPQQLYYTASVSAGTQGATVRVSGYEF